MLKDFHSNESANGCGEALLKKPAATQAFAAKLALQFKPGQVIYLEGPLGAGKTSLVQGVLAAMHYQGLVKSPTYTLVESYELNGIQLFHFDLYRLKDPAELEFMGIREYFSANSICFIEWPERGAGYIPPADWHIQLEILPLGRKLIWRQL